MSAKIKYTNEPIEANIIQDFLPPHEELAFREEGVKVTIALSMKSIEYFQIRGNKTPYSISTHDPQTHRFLC